MIDTELNLGELGVTSAAELCTEDTSYRAFQKTGRKLFQGFVKIMDIYRLDLYSYDPKIENFQEEAQITAEGEQQGHDFIPIFQLPEEIIINSKVMQSCTGSRYKTFIPLRGGNETCGLLLLRTNSTIPEQVLNSLEFLGMGLTLGVKYIIRSRQAERAAQILGAATHTSRQLQKVNNPDDLYSSFINLIVSELGFERATLFIYAEDGKTINRALCACIGHAVIELKEFPDIPELGDHPQTLAGFPGLWLPVNLGSRRLGVLLVDNIYSLEQVPGDVAGTLTDLSGQVALMLDNAQLFSRLQEMALRDDLTGLYRPGYFYERLQEEVARLKRRKSSSGLLIMDIDYFKQVNDKYGHLAGDMVLTNVGNLLRSTLRASDVACRMGGDEFIILLSNADERASCEIANRVLQHFQEEPCILPGNFALNISVSIGVATLSEKTTYWQHAITQADKALYQSKQQGRGRVSLYAGN